MGNGIFGIGVSGLNAAQAGLATTSHNISNVNTPGYTRQEIIQSASTPEFTGSGFLGTGTDVSSVQRIYSSFLTSQSQQAQAGVSHVDAYLAQISQIDNLLGNSANGVQSATTAFFSAINSVAANPSDSPARQVVLSSAQSLAGTLQSTAQDLTRLGTGVNTQLQSSVGSINSLTTQVAILNAQIQLADARNAGLQPPNDLLDQRDALVNQINQQIGVSTVTESSGALNLYISSGQALVVGNQSFALSTAPDTSNPADLQIGLQTGTTVEQIPHQQITGGLVGGLLAFRGGTLTDAENSLGRIATVLSQAFNAQQELGIDQTGQPGKAIFSVSGPQVIPATSNQGTAALSATIANAGALSTSDYRLAYDGTKYNLTRLSDNTTQTFASLPQNVDGVAISLSSGTPNAGDSFLIEPTRSGALSLTVQSTDPSQIAAAAPILAASSGSNLGTGTISPGNVKGPPPTNANLTQPVQLTFHNSGGVVSYDVSGTGTGSPTGIAYTPGAAITYNGWTVNVSGTPSEGDTFAVGPNSNTKGDNRNALLLAQVQSSALVATSNGVPNTLSLAAAYGELISAVGSKASELQTTSTAQTNVLNQISASQQSLSGVNLNEEAANLIKYQQAYQASSKVLVIADQLFNSILAIFQ